MKQEPIKWHRLSFADAERELHTNASRGLSRREARSRFRRGGPNTLFDTKSPTSGHLKRLLWDPVWILLVLVCLFACCFSELKAGIPTLVLALSWLAFVIWYVCTVRKQREKMQLFRIPTVTVIRSGKAVRVSAHSVVRGDVILLQAGDLVPADCRLLSAGRLHVRLSYQQSGADKPTVIESGKNAERIYGYGEKIYAPHYENMVYGGSEVLSGSARVVVVEIGVHTFLGAMKLSGDAEKAETAPRLQAELYPYLRLIGLLSLCMMLPAGIAGLFLSPASLGAWRVFLPVCVFAATSSASVSYLLYDMILRQGKRELEVGANRSCLQTVRAEDCLPKVTDLVILGHAATSDGKQHFYSAHNGSERLSANSARLEGLTPLCEALLLLAQAEEALPVSEHKVGFAHQPYLSELAHACSYDLGALEVRLVRASILPADSSAVRTMEVQMKEGFFRLYFYKDPGAALSSCLGVETKGLGFRLLSAEIKQDVLSFAADATARACRTVTVVREVGSRRMLVGCVACGEACLPRLPKLMAQAEELGIRVRFFLENELPCELSYPAACGMKHEVVRASEGKSLAELGEKHCFFAGFARKDIFSYIQQLRKKGACVAVIGNRALERGILSAASLQVSCVSCLQNRRISGGFDGGEELGVSEGASAAATLKRDADLLLPTANANGGGLASFLQAVTGITQSHVRIRQLWKFLIPLQIFRAVFFLAAVLTGVGTFPPALWFLSAMLPDLIAVLLAISSKPNSPKMQRFCLNQEWFISSFKDRSMWLLPLICAGIWVLALSVLRITGQIQASHAMSFLTATAVLMQCLLLLCSSADKTVHIPLRMRLLPISCWLLLTAFAVLLSLWFPPVAIVTEIGAWCTASWLLLAAVPIVGGGVAWLFSAFFK